MSNARAATAARPATYQDVLDAPAHLVAELIGGTLHTHPRPAPRHATAGAALLSRLHPPFDRGGDDGPGGWRILYEPELHLDTEVLVPDLAGWRRQRMPELPDTTYFTLAPDWICEIFSPGTHSHDLVHKRPIYATAGVAHLWLIDPVEHILEAFELHNSAWTLIATITDDATVRIAPFDAIAFRLDELWD